MNMRTYRQSARADAAAERTERILQAALQLFIERPFDQITLPMVAEHAEVGLQTLIRRVGTKDGLVQAVHEWVVPQIIDDRGSPAADAPSVAAAMARFNERWGAAVLRTIQQQELSPSLAANAAGGRAAHAEWIAACFGDALAPLDPARRRRYTAQLAAVTSTELWMVLRRDHDLSVDDATRAVEDLIEATLVAARHHGANP